MIFSTMSNSQEDLYAPLSADFIFPTNRDVGATWLEDGGKPDFVAFLRLNSPNKCVL